MVKVLINEATQLGIRGFDHHDSATGLEATVEFVEKANGVGNMMQDVHHKKSIHASIFKRHVESRKLQIHPRQRLQV